MPHPKKNVGHYLVLLEIVKLQKYDGFFVQLYHFALSKNQMQCLDIPCLPYEHDYVEVHHYLEQ